MAPTASQAGRRFFPLMAKGYVFGTLVGAVVLHVAIALIAPGDGGTMVALRSGPILLTLLIILGLIGLVAFPLAALASWPFRNVVFQHPLLALFAAIGVGVVFGAVLTATEFRIGPGDFWSGSLVGLVYAVVWFLVVRRSRPIEELDVA